MSSLKRNWWLVAAALVGGFEIFFAVAILFDRTDEPDPGPLYGTILLSIAAAAAGIAILAGLAMRSSQPARARTLMIAGLAPAALAGVVFFWFPPFWLLTALAVTLIVKTSSIGHAQKEPAEA